MSWNVVALCFLLAGVFRIAHSEVNCNASLAACDTVMDLNVENLFNRIVYGPLTPSELSSNCSLWSNCTTYNTTDGCIQNDWYDKRAAESMNFLCGNATKDYGNYYECYNNNSYYYAAVHSLCHVINTPFGRRSPYSCDYQQDTVSCFYRATNGTCNYQVASDFTSYRYKYMTTWYTNYSCVYNRTEPLITPSRGDSCQPAKFVKCLVQYDDLRNLVYVSKSGYIGPVLQDLFKESQFSTNCGHWEQFNSCWDCRNKEIVYGKVDFVSAYTESNGLMPDDYQTATSLLNSVVTPRRMDLICSTNASEFWSYNQRLFTGVDLSNFTSCMSANAQTGNCSRWQYCFTHLYSSIVSRSSLNVSDFLLEYLMTEWVPYLQNNKNCTFTICDIIDHCNDHECTSALKSSASDYTQLFRDGQLSFDNLTALCALLTETLPNITRAMRLGRLGCNSTDNAIYHAMIADVTPYVCNVSKQQDYVYLTNQTCYFAQKNATSAPLEKLFSTVSCNQTPLALFDLYSTLNASCGQPTAEAVAGLAVQFRIIAALPPSNLTTCPKMYLVHPPVIASPQFSGPHYNTSTSYIGSCPKFHFTCRVNYSSSSTDNHWRSSADDGARFDVSLTFDGQLAKTKTTNSTQLEVIFTQDDIRGHFRTTVSCAVRSYWTELPSSKSIFVPSESSYFVGIVVDSPGNVTYDGRSILSMNESAPYMPVYFQTTVPVSLSLQLSTHAGLTVSSCSVTFSSTDPPLTRRQIGIRAVQTPGSNSRVVTLSFQPVTTTCNGYQWDGYRVNDIPVLIVDEQRSSSCMSDGDPHIRTFDNYFYSVFYEGDFVLWRSMPGRDINAEVHVRFQRCFSRNVSCNCAVAFREGNNVIGVHACETSKPPIVIEYLRDPVSPARVDVGIGGAYFYIRMPSGRSMSVDAICGSCNRLSIVVYAISEDAGRSEGLCGNYNGNSTDDTTPKDSATPDNDHEPIAFSKSHLLSKEQSFINGHIYLPNCTSVNITLPTVCQCGQTGPENCNGVGVSAVPLTPAVTFTTNGTERCIRRQKRQTSTAGRNVIGPWQLLPPEPGPPPNSTRYPNATIDSSINETEARTLCEAPLTKWLLYSNCSGFTNDTKGSILQSCSMDVQITGQTVDVVNSILMKYSQACVRGMLESDSSSREFALQQYNASVGSNETRTTEQIFITSTSLAILAAVVTQICPGQPACSGNGACVNQICICNTSYVGADCSLPAGVPPVISGMRYGPLCDTRNAQGCSPISLYVSGASVTSNFSCRITSSSGTFFPKVRVSSVSEIQFDLPLLLPPRDVKLMWSISVSNDNITFSNATSLTVYDSKCMECSNVTASCWQKADTCLIDGTCFASGESNPSKACSKCSPQTSNCSWTQDNTCTSTTKTSTTTKSSTTRSSTVGSTSTTPRGPLWYPWTVWGKCGSGCSVTGTILRQRNCSSPGACEGDITETMNCPRADCPVLASEASEGLVIETKGNSVAKFNDNVFLMKFYDVMLNLINDYCTANRLWCCTQLLAGISGTRLNPATGDMTIAAISDTNIGSGYPKSSASTTLIKVIFTAKKSRVLRYCSASRRKRQTADSYIFLNKQFLEAAILSNVTALNQTLGYTVLNVNPRPDSTPTTTTKPPLDSRIIAVIAVFAAVIGATMIILAGILWVQKRGSKKSSEIARQSSDDNGRNADTKNAEDNVVSNPSYYLPPEYRRLPQSYRYYPPIYPPAVDYRGMYAGDYAPSNYPGYPRRIYAPRSYPAAHAPGIYRGYPDYAPGGYSGYGPRAYR